MIDRETLQHRLQTRTNNGFGKSPEEFELVQAWHTVSEKKDREYGAIPIDATQTLDRVIDELLSFVMPGWKSPGVQAERDIIVRQ